MEFKTVIDKQVLLAQLKKNKTRYVETRKDLVKVYEEKMIEYQEALTKHTKKVVDNTLTVDDVQPPIPYIPEDRSDTYDWYITMLEHHLGDRIEIEDKMFRQLYLDKWQFISEHIHALAVWANSTTTSISTDTTAALAAYTE